jgi:hypothetical protein
MFSLSTDAAWQNAKEYALRAHETLDEDSQIVFERLRDIWIKVANACELLEE